MEYYSTLKRIKLSSHEETWRKLKCMLLHEKKKTIWKGYMMYFPTTWRSGKGEIMEPVKKISGCQEF